VIEQLANPMIDNSILEYIGSDNDPEFIAKELGSWLFSIGVKTEYIEPDSPWEMAFMKALTTPSETTYLMGKSFTA
jgi:putative transposase